jgi:hypothetical protein
MTKPKSSVAMVEKYLRDLRDIRSSGSAVKETSYYGALEHLLNEIGATLKPLVRCIIHPKNRGAGLPDGGLFTRDQFQRATEQEPLPGQLPSRGVVEVKGAKEDAWLTANGPQVSRYWGKYGQVLVTNYRDFILLGQDANGNQAKLETFRLASSEAEFWRATSDPAGLALLHGERLVEYLKRVLLHAAPLAEPREVAWFLASYARDARARIEHSELPALGSIRSALEEALGLKFEGEKGEHFFRSSLIQTLFYGIFSAWVLWSKTQRTGKRRSEFNWHEASWFVHVPVIKALFEQVATPTKLGPLDLVEVLDWTATALNRVDHAAFFSKFEAEYAIQYFYEPFLEAFDPELRKELGVWYTPPEIVKYMVERVDIVLREELGRPGGLADPSVYVLDPCCGTGTYLLEVLRRIATTLQEQGSDALLAADLKRAAMERIFGFEILPAPFVVAHLQLGLLLQNLGAPLAAQKNERVGVYLTNALTGWEQSRDPKQHILPYPELEEERDAAQRVKREAPILVVLGNPPYNAFAGVSPAEEEGLVEPYKAELISKWGIKKFNLDELYIRFLRLAERRIAEMSGRGIVCFISNYSYLGDPSFVVMRQRFLSEFDKLWFDCMNGDSRETGKLTPEGKPDPSVFSTEYNREGIRLGTTIGLMVRTEKRAETARVFYRNFWGTTKRVDLVDSLGAKPFGSDYLTPNPTAENRYSFRNVMTSDAYMSWPRVTELAGEEPISGLQEMRRGAWIDIDRARLEMRVVQYFDPKVSLQELQALHTGLTRDAGRFDAAESRKKMLRSEISSEAGVRPYALMPFDTRWAFYTPVRPLWNEPRPRLAAQQRPGNLFLVTRMAAERSDENVPMLVTSALPDYHLLRPNVVAIPVRMHGAFGDKANKSSHANQQMLPTLQKPEVHANLSARSHDYLSRLGITEADHEDETAVLLWLHALSVGYTPEYLVENADGVRTDFPRIPLPRTAKALRASAKLGRQLSDLLLPDQQVIGVTTGTVRPELKKIAAITQSGGGALDPSTNVLEVRAGWGHPGRDGITMPGRGRLNKRAYTADERESLEEGALQIGLDNLFDLLGGSTYDVYLNEEAFWENVPSGVWDYTIGGYQVLKKWLSYREVAMLGRALSETEVRDFTGIARRISAILLLGPALRESYEAVKAETYAWPTGSK